MQKDVRHCWRLKKAFALEVVTCTFKALHRSSVGMPTLTLTPHLAAFAMVDTKLVTVQDENQARIQQSGTVTMAQNAGGVTAHTKIGNAQCTDLCGFKRE